MKKSLLSLLLVMTLLITGVLSVSGASFSDKASDSQFTLQFVLNDENIGMKKLVLSNIKIDVYSSEQTAFDSKSNITEFTHSYVYSVYTNSKGSINFTKPSDNFLILVDVTTLPQSTGIDKQTVFYHADQKNDIITISSISDISIKYDETAENGITVNALNKNGQIINADYSISGSTFVESQKSLLSEDTFEIEGNVTIGDIVKPYEYEKKYDTVQRLDYVINAAEENEISKSEALNFYLERCSEEGPSTELITQIVKIYEDQSFFEQLPEEVQTSAMALLAGPTYTTHRTFPLNPTSSDYFVIHYEGNGRSSTSTPTYVTQLMTALTTSRTSLVTNLSLLQPKTTTGRYDVYVSTASNSNQAVTSCYSDKTSYLTMYNANLDSSLTVYEQGTAAHEYFHAITNTYRSVGEISLWFCEAFANWAGVRVYGKNTLNITAINAFLNTTYSPLTSTTNNRHYGEALLPLYIKQNHGGDTAIKNIVNQLSTTSNEFTAITNGMSSGTFDSMFPMFCQANYKPITSYTESTSSWNSSPYISQSFSLSGYPNNAGIYTVDKTACHYMNLDVPSSGSNYKLDVTINITSGTASNLKCRLVMTGRSSGTPTGWAMNTSGTLVTYSTTMSPTTYSKACVLLPNISTSQQVSYKLTVARS